MILITGELNQQYADILNSDTLEFLEALSQEFEMRRQDILNSRIIRQHMYETGILPDFDPTTKHIRENDWTVADIPYDMKDRRVEITGPVNAKMVINALNSGANCFMADFEDSNSPTWDNCMQGQVNLEKAIVGDLELKTDKKTYTLNDTIAKLMVRPRGWHLNEKHVLVDGDPISASLFDFGVFMANNGKYLYNKKQTPAFYLPKLESYLEAKLWNDIFKFTQDYLKIPQGTIRATVLIETLPAAFEMDEILWELKDHSAGLNAGRWDYIFSFIKCLGNKKEYVLPNRSEVTMDTHMMDSYSKLLVQTCHRRGIHAMGGMSAYIPRKDDEVENMIALAKVRQDKKREVLNGHDGTWVAHPGLITVAREQFDKFLNGQPHQIDIIRWQTEITQNDLLSVPQGSITYEELCNNVRVSIQYLSSWLTGNGCVPLNYLMEDAATAEISRSQVWQWRYHNMPFSDGDGNIDDATVAIVVDEQLNKLIDEQYASEEMLTKTADLMTQFFGNQCIDLFLTLQAYEQL